MSTAAWPLPVRNLSASAIKKFQTCPEQFRRQYVKGQWDRWSASSVLGNAIHGAVEANFRQKIVTGADLSTSDLEFAYLESFDEEVRSASKETEVDWRMTWGTKFEPARPGVVKDRGRPLLNMYHERVSPGVQPLGVEEWFAMEIEGVPVKVRGKIDLITETEKRDMKFGRSAKESPDNAWLLQAGIYMLVDKTTEYDGRVRMSGLADRHFEWHTGRWGGPQSDPVIHTPAEHPALRIECSDRIKTIAVAQIRATARDMVATYNEFGPDEPWPTSALQHTWACNYCQFGPRSTDASCFWWTGERDTLTLF